MFTTMKKSEYISPAINVVKLQTRDGLLDAVSAGLTSTFGGASEGASDDYADVKEDRGGWGDEW